MCACPGSVDPPIAPVLWCVRLLGHVLQRTGCQRTCAGWHHPGRPARYANSNHTCWLFVKCMNLLCVGCCVVLREFCLGYLRVLRCSNCVFSLSLCNAKREFSTRAFRLDCAMLTHSSCRADLLAALRRRTVVHSASLCRAARAVRGRLGQCDLAAVRVSALLALSDAEPTAGCQSADAAHSNGREVNSDLKHLLLLQNGLSR